MEVESPHYGITVALDAHVWRNKIVTPAMHAATSIRDVPGEMRAVVRSIVTLPMIATARKSDGIAQSPLRVASDMKATVPRISGMRAGGTYLRLRRESGRNERPVR